MQGHGIGADPENDILTHRYLMKTQDREKLKNLEESLWKTETRFDLDFQERVFAEDFLEFGRSGRVYSREECLSVKAQEIRAKLPLENFEVRKIDENTVLVTYISEVQYDEIERANRSSLWTQYGSGWKIRFHQGTPLPTDTEKARQRVRVRGKENCMNED